LIYQLRSSLKVKKRKTCKGKAQIYNMNHSLHDIRPHINFLRDDVDMNNGSLQEISWENVVSKISEVQSLNVVLRVCKMLNILTTPKLQQNIATKLRGYWQSCFTAFDQAKGCDLSVDTTGRFGVLGSGLCKFCLCTSEYHSLKFWLRGCWWGNYVSLGQKYPGEGVYSSHLLLLGDAGKLFGSYCAYSNAQPVMGGNVYAEKKLEHVVAINSLADPPPEGISEYAMHNYSGLECELRKTQKIPNITNGEYFLGNWHLLLTSQEGTNLELYLQFTNENNLAIKGRVVSYTRWLLEDENSKTGHSQSLHESDLDNAKEIALALVTTYADMVAISVSVKNTIVDGAKFSISFLGKQKNEKNNKMEGKFFLEQKYNPDPHKKWSETKPVYTCGYFTGVLM